MKTRLCTIGKRKSQYDITQPIQKGGLDNPRLKSCSLSSTEPTKSQLLVKNYDVM